MPYLAPLEREDWGCKIAVDGHCFGQRLYLISNPIKIQRMTGKMNKNKILAFWCFRKTLAFRPLNFPESTGPRAGSRTRCAAERYLKKKEERREEEEKGRKKGRGRDGYVELPTCLLLKL